MEQTKMILALQTSIDESKIVSVFSNLARPDRFSVGIIEKMSDEQICIKYISPYGFCDGFGIRRLEDIFRVAYDGEYEQKIGKLYRLNKQQHKNLFNNSGNDDSNLFKNALVCCQKLKHIVNICRDKSEYQEDIVGFVKEVNNSEVIISEINEYGVDDGESIIYINDIVYLDCDSEDERMIEMLHNQE